MPSPGSGAASLAMREPRVRRDVADHPKGVGLLGVQGVVPVSSRILPPRRTFMVKGAPRASW